MKALVWLTTGPARTPGSGERGEACPDALHPRPAVRFVAENPSTVFGSQEPVPEKRKEERGGERKQKLQRLHFFGGGLGGVKLFQVVL